jgi:hypothetical protein
MFKIIRIRIYNQVIVVISEYFETLYSGTDVTRLQNIPYFFILFDCS